MYGLGPMEALELAALNGLGLEGAEEDEEQEDESQGDEDSNDENESDDEDEESTGDSDESDGNDDQDDELAGIKKSRDKALEEKRKAKQDLATAQALIKKLQAGEDTRSESERLTESENTIAQQEQTIRQLRLDKAFLASNKHDWQDPSLALKLANLDEVEISEDGEVSGLEEALAEVASKHPYLVKKKEPSKKRSGDPHRRNQDKAAQLKRQQKLRSKYKL